MKFLLLVLFLCTSVAQVPSRPETPRLDWVAKDEQRIGQFLSVVAADDLDVETLVVKFGALETPDDRDLGFGVRRVHLQLYGGYTTIWIDALAEKGDGRERKSRVAALRARQIGPRDRWDSLEPSYRAQWGEKARPIECGFEYERVDAELLGRLRKQTAEALGGVIEPEVPPALARAFALLTSPYEDLPLGLHHGEDGAIPAGRSAVLALMDAGRHDLVRAALRGTNPEGRLYAAWQLRTLTTPLVVKSDAEAIAKLLDLSAPVHTTRGCVQIWISPREALAFLESGR